MSGFIEILPVNRKRNIIKNMKAYYKDSGLTNYEILCKIRDFLDN
jgi:hypothetical protein